MQFGAQGGSGMFGGAGGFAGGGGMFGAKSASASADKVKADGVKKVDAWLQEMLPEEERAAWQPGGKAPDGQETSTIVNQLACQEEGCPDVEVVITLLRPKPRPRLMFKIYKAAADLTREEVEAAVKAALAKEEAGEDAAGEAPKADAGGSPAKESHCASACCSEEHAHAAGEGGGDGAPAPEA